MLVIIGLIGDNISGPSLVLERNFKEQGVSDERLYGELTRLCPWAPELYLQVRGEPLTPFIVGQRYHKMWYENGPAGKGGTARQSSEHYLQHAKLKPLVPAVDALYRKGKPITIEQAAQVGQV